MWPLGHISDGQSTSSCNSVCQWQWPSGCPTWRVIQSSETVSRTPRYCGSLIQDSNWNRDIQLSMAEGQGGGQMKRSPLTLWPWEFSIKWHNSSWVGERLAIPSMAYSPCFVTISNSPSDLEPNMEMCLVFENECLAPSDSLVLANPELSGWTVTWIPLASNPLISVQNSAHFRGFSFRPNFLNRLSTISRFANVCPNFPLHWCHLGRRWQTPKWTLPGLSASHAGRSLVHLKSQTAYARNEISHTVWEKLFSACRLQRWVSASILNSYQACRANTCHPNCRCILQWAVMNMRPFPSQNSTSWNQCSTSSIYCAFLWAPVVKPTLKHLAWWLQLLTWLPSATSPPFKT